MSQKPLLDGSFHWQKAFGNVDDGRSQLYSLLVYSVFPLTI